MLPSRRAARTPLAALASAALAASVAVGITSPAEAFTPDVKTSATTIAAGDSHTLVLTPDGRIYGAGEAGVLNGALPGTSGAQVSTLTLLDALPGNIPATAVSAGQGFSLAIGADGLPYGSGTNTLSQVTGGGAGTYVATWQALSGLPSGVTAVEVAAGRYHSLVLGSDGVPYATGYNDDGQLATGDTTTASTLTAMALPVGVTASKVAAGGWFDPSRSDWQSYSLVLGSNGMLYGTGYNSYGQLGRGATPVQVTLRPFLNMPGGDITAIAAGGSTSYVVLSGSVWSYGNDADGQRACGSCGSSSSPARATGAANVGVTAVAAGSDFVTMNSATGTFGAGANGQSQLAQGDSFTDRTTFVMLAPAAAAPVELAASNLHVLVRTTEGEVHGSGYNQFQQLTGTNANKTVLTLLTGQRMIAYGAPTLPEARVGAAVATDLDRVWSVRQSDQTYTWLVDDVPVAGSATYTPTAGDVGRSLRVAVVGRRTGYADTAAVSSSPVTVQPGRFTGGQVTASGTRGVGKVLSAAAPALSPTPSVAGLQWLRNGVSIAGATGSAYLQVVADAGQRISVAYSASSAGYESYASSAAVGVVPLHNVRRPTIKGTPKVGSKLTMRSRGAWAPRPASYSYRWLRNGKPISKATRTSYRLTTKDRGKRISLRVTARKPGVPSTSAVSPRTAKVKR